MSVGQNTAAGERLRSFVERIENERAIAKQASKNVSAIKAEAKAEGYDGAALAAVVKIRAMKPHDRQEAEALLDMYLHAMGMASEPPLFRAAGLAAIDVTARDQVIDRMKDFVPAAGLGDVTVNWNGKAVRLSRDKSGAVTATDVVEAPKADAPPQKPRSKGAERPPVPDVDAAGAEELGREAARDNRPVIDNPFPFGDVRRARFDLGWRKENGSDGMGKG